MQTSTLKENILAVLIAIILSFAVVFIISNVKFLKAEITSQKVWEQNLNVDFVSYKDINKFEIVVNKNIEGIQAIVVDLIYDPDKVKIEDDKILPEDVSLTFVSTGNV